MAAVSLASRAPRASSNLTPASVPSGSGAAVGFTRRPETTKSGPAAAFSTQRPAMACASSCARCWVPKGGSDSCERPGPSVATASSPNKPVVTHHPTACPLRAIHASSREGSEGSTQASTAGRATLAARGGSGIDGEPESSASDDTAAPGWVTLDGLSSASRSQLSGLPRSSSSASALGTTPTGWLGAVRAEPAAGERGAGREPSRSSIASRAASCASTPAPEPGASPPKGASLNSQSLSSVRSASPRRSLVLAHAARGLEVRTAVLGLGQVLGRLGLGRRLAVERSLRSALDRAFRLLPTRRLDEEGVLAARATHAHAARRDPRVVELELRRTLFASDDQRSLPPRACAEPCARVAPAFGRERRFGAADAPLESR